MPAIYALSTDEFDKEMKIILKSKAILDKLDDKAKRNIRIWLRNWWRVENPNSHH